MVYTICRLYEGPEIVYTYFRTSQKYLGHTEILHGPIWYIPGNTKVSLYFSKMWNRDMNNKRHLVDPNLAFRKTVLNKIGLFDEKVDAYTWDLYRRTQDKNLPIKYYPDISSTRPVRIPYFTFQFNHFVSLVNVILFNHYLNSFTNQTFSFI